MSSKRLGLDGVGPLSKTALHLLVLHFIGDLETKGRDEALALLGNIDVLQLLVECLDDLLKEWHVEVWVECYKLEDDELDDVDIVFLAVHLLPDPEDKQNLVFVDPLVLEVVQQDVVLLRHFWLYDQRDDGALVVVDQQMGNQREDVGLQCGEEEHAHLRRVLGLRLELVVELSCVDTLDQPIVAHEQRHHLRCINR